MVDRKQMGGLLWKEANVIMPLAGFVAAIATLLYVITLFLPGQREGMFFAYLILFPNLLALGIPSLQIGHEEETGTLTWQRSLPIDWVTAVSSKFLIALAACALGWLVCAGGILVALASGQMRLVPQVQFATDPAGQLFYAASFTLMLLCCSFATSWLFRSPAVGLLAVVPVAGAATSTAIYAAFQVESSLGWDSRGLSPSSVTTGAFNLLIAAILFVLAAWLARRRWSRPPAGRLRGWFFNRSTNEATAPRGAYAPAAPIPAARPGLRRALLWQSFWQARGIYLVVALLMIGVITLNLIWHPSRDVAGWIIFATIASAGLLGVACFVGDTTQQRYRFLAERGLTRWTLWWTRMLIPTAAMLALLLVVIVIVAAYGPHPSEVGLRVWTTLMVAAFGMSQLAAMWARRPIVAYMGAVVLLVFGNILCTVVYILYPDYLWTAFLAVGTLALASLRLCRRWSEGDQSQGYHGRMMGWIGIAALAVVVPIAAQRWWTTPEAMPEWRQQTKALAGNLMITIPEVRSLRLRIQHVSDETYVLSDSGLAELKDAVKVAQSDSNIAFISTELPRTLSRYLEMAHEPDYVAPMDEQREWYEGLLTLALNGVNQLSETGQLQAADMADQLELVAARELSDPFSQQLLGANRWNELVGRLRTPEERREDRQYALVFSWVSIVRDGDNLASQWQGGYYAYSPRMQLLSAEMWRSWRFHDLATKVSLKQLREGLPEVGSPEDQRRLRYWRQALDAHVSYISRTQYPLWVVTQFPTQHWNRQFEEIIESVRQAADEV